MPDAIPVPAETASPGLCTEYVLADGSPLDRLDQAAAGVACGLSGIAGLPDLAELAVTAGIMSTLSARISTACQELSGWISDQSAAGKISPAGTASHAWNQIEAAADAAAQMNSAFLLAGDALRELVPDRDGISFDCGNGLHAPVCGGCSCDCHR